MKRPLGRFLSRSKLLQNTIFGKLVAAATEATGKHCIRAVDDVQSVRKETDSVEFI